MKNLKKILIDYMENRKVNDNKLFSLGFAK
jgi:hypothetical protein